MYQHVDAIVYCSSTSGMEAYSFGLPVFRFLTQYLDLETGEVAFSPKIIYSISDIEKTDTIKHAPVQLFSPVNEQIWADTLSL